MWRIFAESLAVSAIVCLAILMVCIMGGVVREIFVTLLRGRRRLKLRPLSSYSPVSEEPSISASSSSDSSSQPSHRDSA